MARRISDKFAEWEKVTQARFDQLKANEEELNKIFIELYGLEDELDYRVPDNEVSVSLADKERDIKSLISYAVGCMFGRYSLDVEGLAHAGGEWNASKYKTFLPDEDNILLISDERFFEKEGIDIMKWFVDFITVVYGVETLEENLDFIAETLGGRGTSRDIIRNYFVKSFFKDHLQTYKKRPIYWEFSSGKQNGFKALIYLHRYQASTLSTMRVDYLHQLQKVYETMIEQLEQQIKQDMSASDKNRLTRQIEKLKKQHDETKAYDAKLGHLANLRMELDLDDGVVVNHEKLQTDENGKNLGIMTKLR